ncbi:DUF1365 domain-containing protein [Desulfogranum mediterraneum]|uniref:DUF1365 domain-containing protein n=1 Tax=Desulfogranum mediterraneum TaxID=160661 RepID=UPI000411D1CB|nr:DUF1365 domain-containing protein [Desulfogranum mediterraneum]
MNTLPEDRALYVGTIGHRRYLPHVHSFRYPLFMWWFNLDALETQPCLGRWFSVRRRALSRFYRPDYFGDPAEPLGDAIRRRMEELTARPVSGRVYGLLNLRTLGCYFSPVNLYYGYDRQGGFSHFMAEVSNIPWNQRHQYGHYVGDGSLDPRQAKAFHVSPFNPMDQHYCWQLQAPARELEVRLELHDRRGRVFAAALELQARPFSLSSVRRQLVKQPAMTVFMVAAIHWQALKLYLKGVPYVPYPKEMP